MGENKLKIKRSYKGRTEHATSTVIIECPWCDCETEAYIFSISGGGKKCDNCPAVHNYFGTSYLKDKDHNKFTKMTGRDPLKLIEEAR